MSNSVGMHSNEHGLRMLGSEDAIRLFDQAVDFLVHMDSRCMDAARVSARADENCPMSTLLICYQLLLTTEAEDAQSATALVRVLQNGGSMLRATDRERAHATAVEAWATGDWHRARLELLHLQATYPRDLLALLVGHQLDIFLADLKTLRNRVVRALPAWRSEDRHYGVVLGMYAFGLEENGEFGAALEFGHEALDVDPLDSWGLHAVAHVNESRGTFAQGVEMMDARLPDWNRGTNFFRGHNWWHNALYRLEEGNVQTALDIFDRELFPRSGEEGSMQLLDAAALLWRIHLQAPNTQTQRWLELAEAWEPLVETPHFGFNDVHAVLAFVGAGEVTRAEQFIRSRVEFSRRSPNTATTYVDVAKRIVLPICEAIVQFGRENYRDVVEILHGRMSALRNMGGSNAQRDVVQQTLLEAALRGGAFDVAQALLSERMIDRPCSPYNWLKVTDYTLAVGDRRAGAELG